MKSARKVLVIMLIAVLTMISVSTAVFADVDYNQWNSQAAYPSDVINTQLFTSVKFLVDNKIMGGYPDGTFKPENNINRAEAAVAIAKMTNRYDQAAAAESINKFNDLSGYGWAKGSINVLTDAGVINGISKTTYGPGKNISYAELVTMLIRTRSGAASEIEAYGKWPGNYIQYAQIYNLLGDISVTDWNAPVTRGDTAKLIYRFAPKKVTN